MKKTSRRITIFTLLILSPLLISGARQLRSDNFGLTEVVSEFTNGNFSEARNLLSPLIEQNNHDAIFILYLVSYWEYLFENTDKNAEIDKNYTKAYLQLTSLAKAGHLSAMLRVSEYRSADRFFNTDYRNEYIQTLINKGVVDAYMLYILANDKYSFATLDRKPLEQYLKNNIISDTDRSFWTSFEWLLKQKLPIQSALFDNSFSMSHATGDGRAFMLGCRLSALALITADIREIKNYCGKSRKYNHKNALIGIPDKFEYMSVSEDSDAYFFRQISRLSENENSLAYTATRWCEKFTSVLRELCTTYSISNHQACVPNTLNIFSTDMFHKTIAYDKCRSAHLKKLSSFKITTE